MLDRSAWSDILKKILTVYLKQVMFWGNPPINHLNLHLWSVWTYACSQCIGFWAKQKSEPPSPSTATSHTGICLFSSTALIEFVSFQRGIPRCSGGKRNTLFLPGNLPPKGYEESFPQNMNRTQQNSNSLNISVKRMFLEWHWGRISLSFWMCKHLVTFLSCRACPWWIRNKQISLETIRDEFQWCCQFKLSKIWVCRLPTSNNNNI